MMAISFRDVLFFLSGIIIPAGVLFYKIVRGQTELRGDVKDIRRYIILLCNKAGIDCILGKER